MRIRALLFVSLAAMAVLGISAGSAAASPTLFTTAAHTARVAVGTTAVGTGTDVVLTSGTAVINTCGDASLNLTLTQNGPEVVANVTASTWNGCSPFAVTGTHTTPWQLTVAGTSYVSGTNTCWNGRVNNVTFDLAGGDYHGNLTTGITACQPTSAGTPVTVVAEAAGSVTGPLTGDGRIDGRFVLTGTAANYSLTN